MCDPVEKSLKQIDADNWESVGEQFVSGNPMQRFGEPNEVAVLVWRSSSPAKPRSSTGRCDPIDGGLSYKY